MERLAFLVLGYSGGVALFTAIIPQDIEIWTRIFMYLSAGILSLITAYYVHKNKGKGGKTK